MRITVQFCCVKSTTLELSAEMQAPTILYENLCADSTETFLVFNEDRYRQNNYCHKIMQKMLSKMKTIIYIFIHNYVKMKKSN